jgi:hypothetical protein
VSSGVKDVGRDALLLVIVGILCEVFVYRCRRGLLAGALGEGFEGRIRSGFGEPGLELWSSRRELLMLWRSFASVVGVQLEPLAARAFYCMTGKLLGEGEVEVEGFSKSSWQSCDELKLRRSGGLVGCVVRLKNA